MHVLPLMRTTTSSARKRPGFAHADPGNDFVAAIDRYGIDLSALMGKSMSRQDSIGLGQTICGYLTHGASPMLEADGLHKKIPRITDEQAANLVSAAQSTLCPKPLPSS
jgi:Protein of unknown function (DUF732)